MEGLFDAGENQGDLFQDKKKKDKKKILKIILVILLVLILLSGSAYGAFYYLTQVKNRDAKAEMIELSKHIDLDEYTDLNGLSAYFDNINNNSYEFNTEFQINSHKYNNAIKDMTKNEDINIKEFKVLANGKVDKNSNKLQANIDLKHKDNNVIDFKIQDTGKLIILHGDKFFNESISIEKSKMKNLMITEYGLENEISNEIEEFTNLSLDTNYIAQSNAMLNSIVKSLPESLNMLEEHNFEIQRNIKVNYRNNSLNAETYILKLNNQEYINFLQKLRSLSKLEANNVSIEMQSLVGKTDEMIDSIINYFTQIINLREEENLSINLYKIKNKIAKVDFIKSSENAEDELIFEIEFIDDKNSKEMLLSTSELNLRITLTRDNSKIYTKIDIDGKIPIPLNLDFNEGSVTEINDDNTEENSETTETSDPTNENENVENTESTDNSETGQRNLFEAEPIVTEPLVVNDENAQPTPEENSDIIGNVNEENSDVNANTNTNTEEAPVVDFVTDDDSVMIDQSIITQKIDLKANLNFDRPLNNSSMMNFNLFFNSNEIEINAKADIMIKDNVVMENPLKIIELTAMDAKKLKTNMEVINKRIYEVFVNSLKSLEIMK